MTKKSNQITFLDFFAGIGGFRTAVERLGGKCLGFAEIDKHARQSYKALYNTEGEREWHDITQVTDHEFAELVGQVDLINAGFPCQAFSVAGKRQGFEDSRGTLFYEVARAAKVIRPKYILLENVKGLLSHDKGNTVDVIFRTLNEIGYTIDFTVLNSKHFGVPQNRERIFIMAVRDDLVTQEAWNIEGTGVVAKAKRRFSGYEGIKSFNFFGWSAQHTTVSKRLRDVLEAQVDEKFYLSDEKTAQLIEKMDDKVLVKEATRLGYAEAYPGDAVNMAQPNSKTRRGRVGRELANTLLTGQEQAVIIENTQVVADLNHYGNDQMNRVYDVEGQSPTIIAVSGGGREPKIAEPTEVRATLTPDRAEKRQNGRRFKEDDEPMFTLTAQDKHGITEVFNDEHKESRTIAILRELQTAFGEEKIAEWRFRVLDTLQQEEVLRQSVHEKAPSNDKPTKINREQQPCECAIENKIHDGDQELPKVRLCKESGCSPQRRESLQQFARELAGIMQKLPHQTTSIEVLCDLWQQTQGVGVLRKALLEIQKIWRSTLHEKPRFRIRKLTVLECWRLQGFSDEQHQKAVDAGVSNSQLYKQAGNSVTVNVIEAIVTQLIELENKITEVA